MNVIILEEEQGRDIFTKRIDPFYVCMYGVRCSSESNQKKTRVVKSVNKTLNIQSNV